MGRHKSWWNNKNLGLWLSRYQYHCTIWLINTVWQFIKNLAKVTKRPLIEVCVEMIMVAFFLVNKRLLKKTLDNHRYCNTSLNIPTATYPLLFFYFLGVFLVSFFVFVFCFANYEKKQLTMYENVSCDSHVISRWHLITTHMILNIETADNELINIVIANE